MLSRVRHSIDVIVIAVYARILRLYPRRFRDEYGDEMRTVFERLLTEAANRSILSAALLCLRKFRDLPINIVREHLDIRREKRPVKRLFQYDKHRELRIVRWLIRIVSLLASALFLYTFAALVGRLMLPTHAVPLAVIFALTAVSLLISWRWEIVGGKLTMLFAVLLGLAGGYATYSYGTTIPDIDAGTHLFATLVAFVEWTIPFLIFGWLFAKVGRNTEIIEKSAP